MNIIKLNKWMKNNQYGLDIIVIVMILCSVYVQNLCAMPAAITDLRAETGSQIQLSWTAADNGAGLPCGTYLVKYSTSDDIVNDTDFINAAAYNQNWPPLPPGATEAKTLTGLIPDTTYWFSIKASSNSVWSAISSIGANSAATGGGYLAWNCPETGRINEVERIKVNSSIEQDTLVTMMNRRVNMILPAASATSFKVTKIYQQIFTPDGDNRNDYVEFQFENPQEGNAYGKIYDLRGAIVGELKNGSNYNSFIWDGRAISGEIARPGIYIYQIEITGSETKVINGVVILAK